MKILNNSIVDTVIEYANVKFGVELEKDTVSAQLKERSFGELMQLTSAIKDEDNDQFSDLIDLSIDEAQLDELNLLAPERLYIRMPDKTYKKVDYRNTTSLHGPTSDGATSVKIDDVDDEVIKKLDLDSRLDYNNERNGVKYKKSDTLAIGHDHQGGLPISDPDIMVYDYDSPEFKSNVSNKIAGKIVKDIDEAYGTSTTSQPSSATIRSQGTLAATDNRRATNAELKASRQTSTQRTVAGSNKTSTGSRGVADPSDNQRNQNSAQANSNSQEIDRLKDLVMKVARGK